MGPRITQAEKPTHLDAVLDEDRLAALDSYGILDTPPEQGFDDIVQLAALACDAPVALVSFVAADRQWFKARQGFPASQTDLDSSVCALALDEPDLLIIPNLAADPRTRGNKLVMGEPHIRFYAGAPLRDPGGAVLGSLCVIDTKPRPDGLDARQEELLRILARQVMALMALRRAVTGRDSVIARSRKVEERLGEHAARLRISEAHWRGLFERLNEGFIIAELIRGDLGHATDWRYLDVNAAWGALMGIDPVSVVGRTVREVVAGIEDAWVDDFARVVETGESATFTRRVSTTQRWYEGRAFPLGGDRFAILFVEVTGRVLAETRREALLEIGDRLRDLGTVEDMTRMAACIVGRTLGVSRAGYGRLEADGEHVVIEPDWTAHGMTSIAGRHRFADYGDIRDGLMLGEPLVIKDALTDPRTADDQGRWTGARIRALVNIPIQERGRTVAVFIVQDDKPRNWTPETLAFLHNVADRLTAAVARVRAEEQQRVLNEELSHRMKNMLAMIQAIAGQTLKGVTEQDAVDGFVQRLHALSSAHDVLLKTRWMAAPLAEVAETVVRAMGQLDRFDFKGGPDVMLGPRATLSVSLLLHELATNAVKYGALSSQAGRVALAWRVDSAAGELVLSWRETGGPAVSEPSRRGFGSRLIHAGLMGTGGATLRYPMHGLEAEMRASLERVQAS